MFCAQYACRKAVKEQLKSLGVNDQIKSLVAEKRNYKPVKGKEPGITKEQAIEELKVFAAFALTCFETDCHAKRYRLKADVEYLCRAEE